MAPTDDPNLAPASEVLDYVRMHIALICLLRRQRVDEELERAEAALGQDK